MISKEHSKLLALLSNACTHLPPPSFPHCRSTSLMGESANAARVGAPSVRKGNFHVEGKIGLKEQKQARHSSTPSSEQPSQSLPQDLPMHQSQVTTFSKELELSLVRWAQSPDSWGSGVRSEFREVRSSRIPSHSDSHSLSLTPPSVSNPSHFLSAFVWTEREGRRRVTSESPQLEFFGAHLPQQYFPLCQGTLSIQP